MQVAIATITQADVADELRGRVGASPNTMISSASLASMAMAGALGDRLGVRAVFILAGGLAALVGVGALWLLRPQPAAG